MSCALILSGAGDLVPFRCGGLAEVFAAARLTHTGTPQKNLCGSHT